MPLRRGRTRTQEGVGNRGSATWVSRRKEPGPIAILGNRPPSRRTQPYRGMLFLYCMASISVDRIQPSL